MLICSKIDSIGNHFEFILIRNCTKTANIANSIGDSNSSQRIFQSL